MICVSLGRTRHKMVLAEHQALAERGAKLVELRLDWLSRVPDLGRLLVDRPTPVIVTCRRPRDKGLWRFTEEQRQTLLRSAIVAGADYVDLEEDIATDIRRYGPTKRIISYHNFDETPADIADIHARLAKLDADIVKIVTMANSPADNVRMLQLVRGAASLTVGFCMGEFGLPSRILTGRYGAPFTYATFHRERQMAPGQPTFDEMRDVYRYDQINEETEVFGVVADPVAHSYSPLIHNAALAHLGLNAVYLPFRVPEGTLAETIREFDALAVKGYSVTLPHKEAVVELADERDKAVDEIGAANTLYRNDRGTWSAANTDHDAALSSLVEALSAESPDKPAEAAHPLAGKKVLLLGAGGVARAIGHGVVRHGGILMVTNRTKARAAELAEQFGCVLVQWENRGAQFADVLINCTSVGMHPGVDETPFVANWLREGMIVFDTVYNPERTLLIKQARERGCRTVTGVEMFVRQAARQFELFTGQPAPQDVMRDTLRQAISPARSS
ncbi:MAG: shikimate dehydrogenase [Planctomycetaceae bacterium]|nr:shikimate dehydrogenase [Planctomycetaceae bacterium]